MRFTNRHCSVQYSSFIPVRCHYFSKQAVTPTSQFSLQSQTVWRLVRDSPLKRVKQILCPSCAVRNCSAEGSLHIFRPLRRYLGGRRLQDSDVEMALREWKSRLVLRMNFWTRTVPHSFHGVFSKTMLLQWNTRAVLNVVITSYLVPVTYELGSWAALVCMPADVTSQIMIYVYFF